MDENTKDAVIAVAGILGTLGGIALGQWLEGRRSDRPHRRAVYAKYIGLTAEAQRTVKRTAADGTLVAGVDPYRPGFETEFWNALGELYMVATPPVVEAANDLSAEIRELLDAGVAGDPDRWERAEAALTEGVQRYGDLARRHAGTD